MLPNGNRYTININPSRNEFVGLMNKSEAHELRGMIRGNDLYLWDSYALTHREVERMFGESDHDLVFHDNKIEFRGVYGSTEEEQDNLDSENEYIADDIKHNHRIQNAYKGVDFKIELLWQY